MFNIKKKILTFIRSPVTTIMNASLLFFPCVSTNVYAKDNKNPGASYDGFSRFIKSVSSVDVQGILLVFGKLIMKLAPVAFAVFLFLYLYSTDEKKKAIFRDSAIDCLLLIAISSLMMSKTFFQQLLNLFSSFSS